MGLNLKKARETYEKKTESKGGIADRWKPQGGENPIRVLPHTLKYFTEEIAEIAFTFFAHFEVGPEGAKEMVVCPKTLNRKNRCPICEANAALAKTGDPADAAMANDMGIRRRYLMNILDLKNAETIAKGVQVLECGPSIHNEVLKWCNEKWGDPLDLEAGRDMTLTMTLPASGDKKRTNYSVEPDPAKTAVSAKLPTNWKEQIKKLETLLPPIKTYDEIKKILEGEVDYGAQGKEGDGAAEAAPVEKAGTGAAPAQASAPSTAKAKLDPEKGPDKPPEDPNKKPDCFGQKFSMKSEKCKECSANSGDACKSAFLSQ
jgi:hypothetical protein